MTETTIQAIFAEASAVHLATATRCAGDILRAAVVMRDSIANGGKVIVFGNGGSAADSQHFAAELIGRFRRNRCALPAMALTTDTSILTSIANDFAYEQVFTRQIEALGREGDVAFGISTSGRSANVLAAWTRARQLGLTTVGLLGTDVSGVANLVDVVVPIPAGSTPRIQEAHRTALHAICELIEDNLANTSSTAQIILDRGVRHE